jgi:hypothetical protein
VGNEQDAWHPGAVGCACAEQRSSKVQGVCGALQEKRMLARGKEGKVLKDITDNWTTGPRALRT